MPYRPCRRSLEEGKGSWWSVGGCMGRVALSFLGPDYLFQNRSLPTHRQASRRPFVFGSEIGQVGVLHGK